MITREAFVKKYSEFVNSITSGTGIFPQTLFSQAIIESQGKGADGNYYPGLSNLSKKYFNFFGIKAGTSWRGPMVNLSTGEYTEKGGFYIKPDWFRVYTSFEESARDYVKFLKENPRYTKAGVFTAESPEVQAQRLQAAGYATNPAYSDLLVKVGTGIKKYISTPGAGGTLAALVLLLLFFLTNKD